MTTIDQDAFKWAIGDEEPNMPHDFDSLDGWARVFLRRYLSAVANAAKPEPVSVSLEKCIAAAEKCGQMDCTGAYIINKREAAKAVLDAAGVKYVD